MKKYRCIILVSATAMLAIGCLERNVRLYVDVSDSCSGCCDYLAFTVNVDGEARGTTRPGTSVRIEEPIGTTATISVHLEKTSDRNHPQRCLECIDSNIDVGLWSDIPDDEIYVYFNDAVLFQNEDIHIEITCQAFAADTGERCEDIECREPPEPSCVDYWNIQRFSPRGACTKGECHYPSIQATCSGNSACAQGACVNHSSCKDIYCDTPPANRCANEEILIRFNPTGYCNGGRCFYAKHEQPCEGGRCRDGACEQNPCEGRHCHHPPAPYCVDEDIRRVFEVHGHCYERDGAPVCGYNHRDVLCPYGCLNGYCIAAECTGTVCNLPPANHCDRDSLVVFNADGTCEEGFCWYASHEQACGRCQEGKCDAPCTGVVCNRPPAAYCLDHATLRSFDPKGACSKGGCLYEHRDARCRSGCHEGQCRSNSCDGVVCNTPPPAACLDDTRLSVWDGEAGVCQDGVCQWAMTTVACDGACRHGQCASPCDTTHCLSPPADHCLNGATRVVYEREGDCQGKGGCHYDSAEETCQNGCDLGRCLP